ncbi:DUF4132 domain-containing protein [Catenulispora sp. NF23]|uniref:DUF4132 domain-containing protein n=1 Tax=Catenulispora pinistramenti TaxID=2705254 RepID=UPI001BAB6442|nr:DUF4132 domain-containing protein [Catenulispora pinistramenti]MBS2535159.1 DUF4132 domain-containing protein [Catenulispora pinistramenti]
MSEDPEDRFELPRKFQRGVLRRERCERAEIDELAAVVADPDVRGKATWRTIDLIVAEEGPAAAVRAFAAVTDADVRYARSSWGHGSVYHSQISDVRWPMMLRLLDLVRSAADEEYAEAVATAEKMRAEYPSPASRAAMSVLALDRPQWCSADIAEYSADDDFDNYTARLLMLATTTREQARELGRRIRDWTWVNDDRRAEGTFLATVGAGADEFLVGCLEQSRWHALNLLPKLPSELAVNTLIGELGPRDAQAALLEAAKRFPRRVLRLLAEAEPATQVDYVLRLHVTAQPGMARGELSALSAAGRKRVEALLGPAGDNAPILVAAAADLPRILVTPPWEDRELGKAAVLKNLPVPTPVFCWPTRGHVPSYAIPEIAPSPEEADEQGRLVATMAVRLNSEYDRYAESAHIFFRRYPEDAIRHLLPLALGPTGLGLRKAQAAVRFVARQGWADVLAIAAESGPEAAHATQALLERRGLDAFPKSMPAVPLWAEPASLPPILLAGRRLALPASAVRLVVQMLTISSRRDIAPYGGVEIVKESCDAVSLAEFAWGLFENWAGAGYPTKKLGWAFDVLQWFGDAETARRLVPLIRAWPGEGGSARAAVGMDVLIAIGGDEGIREVYDISQRSQFGALRDDAAARIAIVATARGLSADQLEDRLVLDLGAGRGAGGCTLPLDYGPRRFTVGFDEYLQPFVTDDAGKRRAALPKPAAKDDAALAARAQARFTELKKDSKTLAVRQAARLERAMVTGRKWSEAEFRALFIEHPLMRLLGRRLVWGQFDGSGALHEAFRIAEDGTLADVDDERFVFDAGLGDTTGGVGAIGLVHPVTLGRALPRWVEICHDYEIVQPFPQVGRPIFALTAEERTASRLARFCDVTVPTDRLLALHRSPGWGTMPQWEAARAVATARRVPGDRLLIVQVTPGYRPGSLADTPRQSIRDIWLSPLDTGHGYGTRTRALPLGDLDAVEASEIIADLTTAVAP